MKASIHETTEINGCFENSLEISAENAKKDWKFVKNWKITKKEKIHEKTRKFIKSQQCIEIRCIHEKSMWKLVYSWKIRCIHELIIQYSMETLGLALGLYKKLDIMRLFKKIELMSLFFFVISIDICSRHFVQTQSWLTKRKEIFHCAKQPKKVFISIFESFIATVWEAINKDNNLAMSMS